MTGISCPVCGWEPDVDADSPRDSVIAHMSSSKGEHEGIGFQKAGAMLDANTAVSLDTDVRETNIADISRGSSEENHQEPASDDAGLGLSGDIPVQKTTQAVQDVDDDRRDDQPDDQELEVEAVDDVDDSSSGRTWGLLVGVAGLGVVVLTLIGRRNTEQSDTDDDGEETELDLV